MPERKREEIANTGSLPGKKLTDPNYIPEGGLVWVPSGLIENERIKNFPLGRGQEYRFLPTESKEIIRAKPLYEWYFKAVPQPENQVSNTPRYEWEARITPLE